MLLLYCNNSLVVGWHDDTDNVTAAQYPSGTRIIPYDQPIGTLTKVGTAPLNPRDDARPYAQPTETPHLLTMYAGQCRYNYVMLGVTYNGNRYDTDRTSQMLIGNLAAYAKTLVSTTIINFTQNNVSYHLTAQDVQNLNTQINAMAQQYRGIEAACIADLNSTTPTIKFYSDVDTKFSAGQKW